MALYYSTWLLFFGLLINLQAWFINGIFTSAAGESELMPDGTEKNSEMIFFPIKKFLTRTKKVVYFYQGKGFDDLVARLKAKFGSSMTRMDTMRPMDGISVPDEQDKSLLNQMINSLGDGTKILWKTDGSNSAHFYKELDVPVYSKWLRKPIISCPKCMASFWGSITYWSVLLPIFGFHWWELAVWCADVIILAYVSWFWFKQTD